MVAEWIEKVPNWEQEYLTMNNKLSKRQMEILNGSPLSSQEGMVFGGMYSDWKKRRGFDNETD